MIHVTQPSTQPSASTMYSNTMQLAIVQTNKSLCIYKVKNSTLPSLVTVTFYESLCVIFPQGMEPLLNRVSIMDAYVHSHFAYDRISFGTVVALHL